MNRYPSLFRLMLVVLAVAVTAAGCTGDDGLDELRREIERENEASADVEPPPVADPTLTGRVGLIVATNSRTWGRLLGSPTATGVVVLFVQPGGSSDGSGIEVGDVITGVDDESVTNAERGVVQLRARPGQEKALRVAKRDGSEDTIAVVPEESGPVDLCQDEADPRRLCRAFYMPWIEERPDDPVLRFLRAQAEGEFDELLADVDAAIELSPGFVEAISLRAEQMWNRARLDRGLSAEQVEELRDRAMTDWNLGLRLDPLNTRVLVSRAQALAQVGNAASAKRDAERARTADPDFPGAHYAHALADLRLGRHGAAAAPARRAIELNPYDVRYYELLGAIFARLGQPDDCRSTVEAIIDLVDEAPIRERMLRICQS